MATVLTSDRRATRAEVLGHREELLKAAARSGVQTPRLRADGAVIVTAGDRGYRSIALFANEAAALVGAYVHVISDDVPAADADAPNL
jgi:hypothetical protein